MVDMAAGNSSLGSCCPVCCCQRGSEAEQTESLVGCRWLLSLAGSLCSLTDEKEAQDERVQDRGLWCPPWFSAGTSTGMALGKRWD